LGGPAAERSTPPVQSFETMPMSYFAAQYKQIVSPLVAINLAGASQQSDFAATVRTIRSVAAGLRSAGWPTPQIISDVNLLCAALDTAASDFANVSDSAKLVADLPVLVAAEQTVGHDLGVIQRN
jgi:hypothetical protein